MGLTDQKFDNEAGLGTARKDDKTGTFWLLFDKVQEEKTLKGEAYLRAYRTTVAIRDEGDGEQAVGDETTHMFWPDPKAKFFETETRKLVQLCLGLSDEEATALPTLVKGDTDLKKASVLKRLLKDKVWSGVVLEAKCTVLPKKEKPQETYTKITYTRRVPSAELLAELDKKTLKRFFPEGVDQFPAEEE